MNDIYGNQTYGRDLDLNLLRVFAVVADTGSVTRAAAALYLTQPAVSAALKRLTRAIGEPLFARQGRGLVLSARGRHLLAAVRPHLAALTEAALAPVDFDPATSERVVRLGLADATEGWLLPPLLRELGARAPRMRLVVRSVQFRNVGEVLSDGRIDLAVAVADELPAGIEREPLFHGKFFCLFDPRHVRLGRRPSRERYLAQDHVIVSYNGDLRGVIEDAFGVTRRVRCSVSSFSAVGPIVDDSPLVATVPAIIAHSILAVRPHLALATVPFEYDGNPVELLWRSALADDGAVAFVLGCVRELTRALMTPAISRPRTRRLR